jgi:hypothetical protein
MGKSRAIVGTMGKSRAIVGTMGKSRAIVGLPTIGLRNSHNPTTERYLQSRSVPLHERALTIVIRWSVASSLGARHVSARAAPDAETVHAGCADAIAHPRLAPCHPEMSFAT